VFLQRQGNAGVGPALRQASPGIPAGDGTHLATTRRGRLSPGLCAWARARFLGGLPESLPRGEPGLLDLWGNRAGCGPAAQFCRRDQRLAGLPDLPGAAAQLCPADLAALTVGGLFTGTASLLPSQFQPAGFHRQPRYESLPL